MPVYVVFLRESEVHAPEELVKYQTADRPDTSNISMRPLAVYGQLEALEGEAPDGVTILEFATMDDAKAWYNSPEYQAASIHRRNAADYRTFIVEGFSMPT